MHVRRASARGLALLVLASCGPDVAPTDEGGSSSSGGGDTTTGRPTSATTAETGETATSSDSTALGSSSASSASESSSSSSSSSGGAVWAEPELLAVLDGDPIEVDPRYIAVTAAHIHVGAVLGNPLTRHWVLDRDSGRVVATSVVGGPVIATADFVYASGPRTGQTATDMESAVTRMDHDGANETEVLVTEEQLFAFAGSPTTAFIQGFPDSSPFELWQVEDGQPSAEFITDLGQQSMGWAIYDDERLLVPEMDGEPILALDLDTLDFESLVDPPEPAFVLWASVDYLFVGTEGGIVRAQEPKLAFEPLDDSDSVWFITGDDEELFWLTSGDSVRLWSSSIEGSDVVNLPLESDLGGIESIGVAEDSIYIVAGLVVDVATEHSGSVWRLERGSRFRCRISLRTRCGSSRGLRQR